MAGDLKEPREKKKRKPRPDLAERNRKNSTHNMTISPTYYSWTSMKKRCLKKYSVGYPNYGGRGITICDRWMVFENFLEDMGVRPDGRELDRIDNDGNYSKENCRWASRIENNSNTRANVFLDFNGQRKTISQWGRDTGLGKSIIRVRLARGWSVENALTTKPRETKRDAR